MSRLTVADRVLIVQLYYSNGESPTATISKFIATKKTHNDRDAPTHQTIRNIIERFCSTGSVADLPRSGRPGVSSETISTIKSAVEEHHGRVSISTLSESTDIPHSTVHKILKSHLLLYPYRLHILQHLNDNDLQSRKVFCQKLLNTLSSDSSFTSKVLWTDEAHFHLSGEVNTWNCRIWSDSNPLETFETPLWSPKVTVWIGFSSTLTLTPFFFEDPDSHDTVTVNSERYCKMLQNHVIPQLKQRRKFSHTIFMQDGASPHTANLTKSLLTKEFGSQIISRGFDFSWPSHSPDLNPCDFWLWGHLKSFVFRHPRPANLGEVKQRILDGISEIPKSVFSAAVDSVESRAELCLERGGGHINPDYN